MKGSPVVNLKQFRQKRNLTQTKAAEAIGIDQRQWNRYEQGDNDIPVRYVIAICKAFKCSANELLNLEKEKNTKWIIVRKEEFLQEVIEVIKETENSGAKGIRIEISDKNNTLWMGTVEAGGAGCCMDFDIIKGMTDEEMEAELW